jgi:hypothetical protein
MDNENSTGKSLENGNQLIENIDYYMDENGLLVFTKAYHLKRGYCCKNGCRHCPYETDVTPPQSIT